MDKVYSRSYTLQSEEKFRDEYLGTFPPPNQCATKIVSTGEQCQNEGVKYIGDTTTGKKQRRNTFASNVIKHSYTEQRDNGSTSSIEMKKDTEWTHCPKMCSWTSWA